MVSLGRLARLLTLLLVVLLLDFRIGELFLIDVEERISIFTIGSSSECSRHLPEVSNQSSLGSLSGDVQLLIPAWRFNCRGTVLLWEALVQGNLTNSSSGIEFQVFKPDLNNSNVFHLVYGNSFNKDLDSQNGSRVTMEINYIVNVRARLPIRAGYIVGVHLNSSSVQLLYNSSGDGGVDVYYWENQGSGRICDFSICDSSAKVLKDVTPLISWNYG